MEEVELHHILLDDHELLQNQIHVHIRRCLDKHLGLYDNLDDLKSLDNLDIRVQHVEEFLH